jgi:hypothetical protein
VKKSQGGRHKKAFNREQQGQEGCEEMLELGAGTKKIFFWSMHMFELLLWTIVIVIAMNYVWTITMNYDICIYIYSYCI